jgi:dephospho-CoA kinase
MLRNSLLMRAGFPYTTILGFTGGIASGKSSRCQHLLKIAQQKALQPGVSLGVSYINADLVGHSMYAPGKTCFSKILDAFGKNEVLAPDGTIDRKRLGRIVFKDKREMERLNAIIWPHFDETLLAEIERKCEQNTFKDGNRSMLIILEAAVLIEQGFVKHCNDVWLTSCSKEEAVRRIVKRNGVSEEEALCQVNSQWTVEDRLSFLRSSGFSGSIQHFDTTNVSLEVGLKQVAITFDDLWANKLRPMCRGVAAGTSQN